MRMDRKGEGRGRNPVRMDRKGERRDRNPNWQALDAVLGKKFKMFQDVKHGTIVWMFGGS